MQRCYVHIGAPKTGSSFLQRTFSANREALLAQGILYPDVSLRGHGHHDLAFLLAGGYPEWATPQDRSLVELETELARAANRHDGHLLLSSEDFYLYPQPERLCRLLHDCAFDYRPTIVVYVRRQDEAHESWYNQRVKAQGFTGSIEESIEESASSWDYATQLDRWARVFGREQLIVRVYDGQSPTGTNLAADLFGVIGIDGAPLTPPDSPVNGGLPSGLLEFQRQLNRLPLTAPEKRKFHDELIELSMRTAHGDLFGRAPLLGTGDRRRIVERYAEGNARIAREYFGGRAPFSEIVDDAAAPAAPALSVEQLAAVMGWLLARDIPRPTPEPEPEPCLSTSQ